jgi:hypothetical protein
MERLQREVANAHIGDEAYSDAISKWALGKTLLQSFGIATKESFAKEPTHAKSSALPAALEIKHARKVKHVLLIKEILLIEHVNAPRALGRPARVNATCSS